MIMCQRRCGLPATCRGGTRSSRGWLLASTVSTAIALACRPWKLSWIGSCGAISRMSKARERTNIVGLEDGPLRSGRHQFGSTSEKLLPDEAVKEFEQEC